MNWLRDAISGYQQSLRRTVALIILLMVVFGVIAEARTAVIVVASLQLSKQSVIFGFLPAFIAYLYAQVAVETNRVTRTEEAYEAAFNEWLPKNKESRIHLLAEPAAPPYWSLAYYGNNGHGSKSEETDETVSSTIVMLLLFSGMAFEIAAYTFLFQHQFTGHQVAFIISACVTSICALVTLILISKQGS
jgi:glucose uptake protein GlcU